MRGVTFDTFHTFEDWGLNFLSYDVTAPEPILRYIDIPGRKTKIDATESLYGRIPYENRTLTFRFWIRCTYPQWMKLDSSIQRKIGGKRCKIILDTEPDIYWMGRVTVESTREDDSQVVIAFYTIQCDVEPYKYWSKEPEAEGQWLWDPFSFIDGVIQTSGDIQVSGSKTVSLKGYDIPCWPVVTSTASMTVRVDGKTYSLTANKALELEDIDAENRTLSFAFTGTGRVSIGFKGETL